MVMTPSLDLQQLQASISHTWVFKERVNGEWVERSRKKNILTNYGLTAYSSAAGGVYVPPNYMVINQTYTTQNTATTAGATSVTLAANPTQMTDTTLVLSAGLAAQETVTFTAVSGTGPYVFTLSPAAVNAHGAGDKAARGVTPADLITIMAPEPDYDATYAHGLRLQSTAGYSSGLGIYVLQFYFSGTQAQGLTFMTIGLADTPTQLTGNLHNILVQGYVNPATGNDLEIDVIINTTNHP